MEFMLFMMFFTSPPASKADPVWTLQSTAQFQFASMPACIKYGQHLQDMLDSTDTVKMRGWCVDQGSGISTFAVRNPNCFGLPPNVAPPLECQAPPPRVGGSSEEIVPNLNVKRNRKRS